MKSQYFAENPVEDFVLLEMMHVITFQEYKIVEAYLKHKPRNGGKINKDAAMLINNKYIEVRKK